MAQIENVTWSSTHFSQKATCFGSDCFRGCAQKKWVKVALDSDISRQLIAHLGQAQIRIEAQNLRLRIQQISPVSMGAF